MPPLRGQTLKPFRFNVAPLRCQFLVCVHGEGFIARQIIFRFAFKEAEVIDQKSVSDWAMDKPTHMSRSTSAVALKVM